MCFRLLAFFFIIPSFIGSDLTVYTCAYEGEWRGVLALLLGAREQEHSGLIWPTPTAGTLGFIQGQVTGYGRQSGVASIGAGTGLFEWLLASATGKFKLLPNPLAGIFRRYTPNISTPFFHLKLCRGNGSRWYTAVRAVHTANAIEHIVNSKSAQPNLASSLFTILVCSLWCN